MQIKVSEQKVVSLERFSNLDAEEDVYGISMCCKGDKGIAVHPYYYETSDDLDVVIQKVQVRNNQYFLDYKSNILRSELSTEWCECFFELFVKRGSKNLDYQVMFIGNGNVCIKDIKLVKGGFPERKLVDGAPYLNFINQLTYNDKFERPVSSRVCIVKELPEWAKDFMKIDINCLLDMIPTRRSLLGEPQLRDYLWSPCEPDMLIEKDSGKKVKPEEIYTISGYEDVVCPSGKIIKYPYYLKPRKLSLESFYISNPDVPAPDQEILDRFFNPDFELIYTDYYMVSTRIESFFEAAKCLAGYYNDTGNREAAIRAACIVAKLAAYQLDWPMYGRPDWNYNACGFWDDDSYENWFAFFGSGASYWLFGATRDNIHNYVDVYESLRGFDGYDEVNRIIGYEPQKAIKDAVIYILQRALKYDAYYRCDLWKFYHNTISAQIRVFIEAGMSIGCPDIIHYAVEKVNSACEYLFMNDGFFPESVSYMSDMLGILKALISLKGYSDPEEYTGYMGTKKFSDFDIFAEISRAEYLINVYKKMKFPDGSELALHDTWSSSHKAIDEFPVLGKNENGTINFKKDRVDSYLLPDFGHGVMGAGRGNESIETHLHYSCKYNHAHEDMLNLNIWAYGDELLSDLGYTHLGGYPSSTVAHNTVVVDKKSQGAKIGDKSGNLIDWYVDLDNKFMSVNADTDAYRNTKKYRRSAIMIELEDNKHCVIDVFEVSGGNIHDYMLSGVADYSQKCKTELVFDEFIDNLADDGHRLMSAFTCADVFNAMPYDFPDEESKYYGMFFDAKIANTYTPFSIAFNPEYPDGESFPGAGPRALQPAKSAGLKIHFPSNNVTNAKVILCKAPRYRFYHEHKNHEEALNNLYNNHMHKIIIRSEGEELDNTFVTVFEPFEDAPFIKNVSCETNNQDGVVLKIVTENDNIMVLFKKNSDSAIIKSDNISSNARLAILKNDSVYIYGGGIVNINGKEFICDNISPAEILSVIDNKKIIVRGSVPSNATYCVVTQINECNKHLKIERIETLDEDKTEITICGNVGFDYNYNDFLREKNFPHRTLYGKAYLQFQRCTKIEYK